MLRKAVITTPKEKKKQKENLSYPLSHNIEFIYLFVNKRKKV